MLDLRVVAQRQREDGRNSTVGDLDLVLLYTAQASEGSGNLSLDFHLVAASHQHQWIQHTLLHDRLAMGHRRREATQRAQAHTLGAFVLGTGETDQRRQRSFLHDLKAVFRV